MAGIHPTSRASNGSPPTGCASTSGPGSPSGTSGGSIRVTPPTSLPPRSASTSARTPNSSGRPRTSSTTLLDALARLVEAGDGMTAAELRAALGSAGYHVDEPTVHRLLHSAHGRFRCEGGGAARWWPAAARRPTIPARTG